MGRERSARGVIGNVSRKMKDRLAELGGYGGWLGGYVALAGAEETRGPYAPVWRLISFNC